MVVWAARNPEEPSHQSLLPDLTLSTTPMKKDGIFGRWHMARMTRVMGICVAYTHSGVSSKGKTRSIRARFDTRPTFNMSWEREYDSRVSKFPNISAKSETKKALWGEVTEKSKEVVNLKSKKIRDYNSTPSAFSMILCPPEGSLCRLWHLAYQFVQPCGVQRTKKSSSYLQEIKTST